MQERESPPNDEWRFLAGSGEADSKAPSAQSVDEASRNGLLNRSKTMDLQEMTDHDHRVLRSRQFGASMYRAEGHDWFACRVEEGLEDSCNPVRLERFFQDLPDLTA